VEQEYQISASWLLSGEGYMNLSDEDHKEVGKHGIFPKQTEKNDLTKSIKS